MFEPGHPSRRNLRDGDGRNRGAVNPSSAATGFPDPLIREFRNRKNLAGARSANGRAQLSGPLWGGCGTPSRNRAHRRAGAGQRVDAESAAEHERLEAEARAAEQEAERSKAAERSRRRRTGTEPLRALLIALHWR